MKYLKMLLGMISIAWASSLCAQSPVGLSNCEGIWTGDLEMVGRLGQVRKVPMRLDIIRSGDSVWVWKTVYDENKVPIVKDYLMRLVNEREGKYMLDERDGILINVSLMGNKFYSLFDVEGTILSCTYQFTDSLLFYEIVSGPSKPEKTSKLADGNKVNSYEVKSLQRAVLRRKQ